VEMIPCIPTAKKILLLQGSRGSKRRFYGDHEWSWLWSRDLSSTPTIIALLHHWLLYWLSWWLRTSSKLTGKKSKKQTENSEMENSYAS